MLAKSPSDIPAAQGAAGTLAPLLTIDKVGRIFGAGEGQVTALDGIDMTIGKGEFVAIVGPSGCGKSTLLRLLAGLDRPTSGNIAWSDGHAGHSSVAFQEHRLLPWSSVLDNIMLPASMRRRPTDEDRTRALELAKLVGLEGFVKSRPAELSGGMRQRASVARSLFPEPDLLLLDEPFGALDALTREKITGDTEEIWLNQRFTALLITHSIAEAVHLADRVFVMSPRPGRVTHVVQIDLERPRAPLVGSDRYNALVNDIRAKLQDPDHG